MAPRIVSSNTYIRCFQYKVLNNALFQNKKLFLFKKSNSPLRSFCKEEDKTAFCFYFCYPDVRNLWNQLKFYLADTAGCCFWLFRERHYQKRNTLKSPFSNF